MSQAPAQHKSHRSSPPSPHSEALEALGRVSNYKARGERLLRGADRGLGTDELGHQQDANDRRRQRPRSGHELLGGTAAQANGEPAREQDIAYDHRDDDPGAEGAELGH